MNRVAVLDGEADGDVAGLVDGGRVALPVVHYEALALDAHQDFVARVLDVRAADRLRAVARRGNRRLIQEVREVCAGEAGRAARDPRQVEAVFERQLARMDAQYLLAPAHVGEVDGDLAVEATGARERGVEYVGAVGRGDDDDAAQLLEAVHLDEELVERLILVGGSRVATTTAAATERVNLVNEDDAGRELARAREQTPDARRAEARELLLEARTRHRKERNLRLAGRGAREQGLARARRAGEQ